jgi:prophage DNA circulation protein
MGFVQDFKNAITGQTPGNEGVTPEWFTNLKDAQFKSPSGAVIPFLYEDLALDVEKKTSIFQTSRGNGVFVQDNGYNGNVYPMTVFFTGDDHEKQGQAFLAALLESGPGVLTHPFDGDITVVCGGSIRRDDRFVTAANQTSFTITFYETTGLQIGGSGGFDQVVESFEANAAAGFEDALNVSDVANEETFKNGFTRALDKISEGLTRAQNSVGVLSDALEEGTASINNSIDILVGQPLTLARQTQLLIKQPAQARDAIRAKLDAYKNLAGDIFGVGVKKNKYDNAENNKFHGNNLLAGAMVSACAQQAINADYTLKKDYISVAELLAELWAQYQAWLDAAYQEIEDTEQVSNETTVQDSGYSDLQQIISTAIGNLIAESFEARTEIEYITTGERTPVELCFELYGNTDELDLFYESNDFSGDEHTIIPQGRTVVYYV